MPPKFVVDAHALVWFMAGSSKLGSQARAVLEAPDSLLVVPAIALAEACWLIAKGRTKLGPVQDFLDRILGDARIAVDPLDYELIEWTTRLEWDGEMHDRQIVAAALRAAKNGSAVSVLTADESIRHSGLVPIVW